MDQIKTSYTLVLIIFALTGMYACEKESSGTPLFQLLPAKRTGVDFSNNVQDQDSLNIIKYIYYYNGGGVGIGDINNDDLPDIYFVSNLESNRLYLNKGNLQFEDITEAAGVGGNGNWSTGVTLVDINADGWLDNYVCQVGSYKNFTGRNLLFINNGPNHQIDTGENRSTPVSNIIPSFTESAAVYGLDYAGFSTQAAFLDYDLDNDLDMYLLCHAVHSTDSYQDTSRTRKKNEILGDKLFRNDLNTKAQAPPFFSEVGEEAGIISGSAGYGLGIAVGDLDQNGCPDIYIGNDFHENDFIYMNNCDGSFIEMSSQILGHTSNFSMGNDMADINNDTWLDIVTLDMKPRQEVIWKQTENTDPFDIYQYKRSFGYHHQFPRNMLQLNRNRLKDQEIRFSEIGQMVGIAATDWSWSALLADFDNNGWKDLHITNGILRRPNDLDYLNFVADNTVRENASALELISQMPEGKVANYVFAQKQDGTFEDKTRHWGLDRPSFSHGAAYADLDRDGNLDLVVNNMNEMAFIYENQSTHIAPSNGYLAIKLKGPRLAVGDVNGDGLQDVFIGGASQQSGSLFIQTLDGKFEVNDQIVFQRDSLSEDVGIAFFDADGDNDLDLYLGSGGNQFYHEHDALRDRLYLNDGAGNFSKSMYSLPPIFNQSSCIKPADFDQDGDIDLFVGSRSVAVNYGKPADSYLLINDGSAHFTIAGSEIVNLSKLGMVTDAAWTDTDSDGDLDLIVIGEWMPLTLFQNQNGRLQPDNVPTFQNSSGWWNTIETADIDQDGDEDWIVGNFGTNSPLQPTLAEPVQLYVRDFDKNLSSDPIISYYQHHKQFTFAGLDALSKQLVFLKKRFRKYSAFSNSSITEIFTEEELRNAARLTAHLFHSVLVRNNGQDGFKIEKLPFPVHMSPVQAILIEDFDTDGSLDILLGGNLHQVQPSIGRQDASYGTYLKGFGDGSFGAVENGQCGLLLEGQIRDLQIITLAGQKHVLAARNNNTVQIYSLNQDQ